MLSTTRRVLTQLSHDHRTVALMLLMPSVLVGLFAWMFSGGTTYQRIGPVMLALFPFILMFIVASITTLRERQSGTLEHLMTTPLGTASLIFGYAIAFSIFAIVQTLITVAFAIWVCGLDVAGPTWQLFLIAIVNAITGTALGLFVSAFARSEFQAVQFLPLFVFPQIILGGVFMPRGQMPDVLQWIARIFPLTYAIDAVSKVARATAGWELWRPVIVLAGFAVLSLVLASLTLPRRTE